MSKETSYVKNILYWVAKKKDAHLLDALIEEIGGVNVPDANGRNLVINAVDILNLSLLRMLKDRRVNFYATDIYGNTAPDIALKNGAGAEIYFFLKQQIYEYGLLLEAAEKGDLGKLRFLIKNGYAVNAEDFTGETLLVKAVQSCKADVVDFLIKQGANLWRRSKDGENLLMLAKKNIRNGVIIEKILIEAGLCDDHRQITTESKEPSTSSTENLEMQVQKSSFATEAKKNLLLLNIDKTLDQINQAKDEALLDSLIKEIGGIDVKDFNGDTLVMKSVKIASLTLLQMLKERGADIHVKSRDGESAIMLAVQSCSLDVVDFLIKSGANLNDKSRKGEGLTILAARSGNSNVVDFLIKELGDVENILISAIKNKDLAATKALIDAEANVNYITKTRETACGCVHVSSQRLLRLLRGEPERPSASPSASSSTGMTTVEREF